MSSHCTNLTMSSLCLCHTMNYSLCENYCLINSPGGHLCFFFWRALRKMNSPESQICNSIGPCSKHRNYIIQKLIRIRGRSAKEYVIFLDIDSPTKFSVYHTVWKATKEYLNHRGTKIRVFRVRFRAPSSHPFSLILPPLSPSSPSHFPTTLHLPLYPPFF